MGEARVNRKRRNERMPSFFTWKNAFFLLVFLQVAVLVVGFILIRFSMPEVNNEDLILSDVVEGHSLMDIQTNRERINKMLASVSGQAAYPYVLEVKEKEVEYRSNISILGQNVAFTVNLQPEVVENGDLLLQVEHVNLGFFTLPISSVLNWVAQSSEFPEWVEVYPNEELLHIKITEYEVGEGMLLRFNQFDLDKDEISLELISQ